MKNKKNLVIILCAMIFLLTGCGRKIETPGFIKPPHYSAKEKSGDRMAQYWLNGKE